MHVACTRDTSALDGTSQGYPSAVGSVSAFPMDSSPVEGTKVALSALMPTSLPVSPPDNADALYHTAAAAIHYLFIRSSSPPVRAAASALTPPTGERMTVYTLHRLLLLCGIKRQHCDRFITALLSHLLTICYPVPASAAADRGPSAASMPSPNGVPVTRSSSSDESRRVSEYAATAIYRYPVAAAEVRRLWTDTESWQDVARQRPIPLSELLAAVSQWPSSTAIAASGAARELPASPIHIHATDSAYVLCVDQDIAERLISRLFVEELRGQMMTVNPIPRWRMACRLHNKSEVPLIILCGGTSGSGKSTLASLLSTQLGIDHVLSTDTVRQLLRVTRDPANVPELFVSTYEAYKVSAAYRARIGASDASNTARRESPTAQEVADAYTQQANLVLTALDATLDRLIARGESVVIEGVHLLPAYMARKQRELLSRRVICLPVLVQIRKEARHMERFSVRAKCMSLDPGGNRYVANFPQIRAIQSHLSAQAAGLPVLSINNTNVDKSLMLVHYAALQLMEHVGMQGWPSATKSSVTVRAPVNVNAKKMLLYLQEHRNDKKDMSTATRRCGAPRLCCDRHARLGAGQGGGAKVSCPHNSSGMGMCNYCAALHELTTPVGATRTRSAELLTATQRRHFEGLMAMKATTCAVTGEPHQSQSHNLLDRKESLHERTLISPQPAHVREGGTHHDASVDGQSSELDGRQAHPPTTHPSVSPKLFSGTAQTPTSQTVGAAALVAPFTGAAPLRSFSHDDVATGRQAAAGNVSSRDGSHFPKHSGDDEDEVGSLLDPSEEQH